MRIAYVEDNVTNLALVERVARMNQHTIVSFSEGEVAIQELVRQKFDLILMDIELAGEMGGLQVVQHLRGQGITTPIVAVTAYAMMGDRERFLEAGCNDYLPKPLPIAEFLVLLAKYDMAKRETQSAAQVAPQPAPQPSAPAVETPASPIATTTTPANAPAVPVEATPPVTLPVPMPAAPVPTETVSPAPPTPTPDPVPAVASVRAPMVPLREEDTATKPIPRLASLRASIRASGNVTVQTTANPEVRAADGSANSSSSVTVPAAPAQNSTPPVPASEPGRDNPAPSSDVPPSTRVP